MTPPSQDQSMMHDSLITALNVMIESGTRGEKQLARLAKDLIDLTGSDPAVIRYINMKAARAANGEDVWT